MQNSMVMFTFFVFSRKYPVSDIVVQKIKIDSLRWNLISRLIQICQIQWSVHFFRFWPETPFLGKFGPNWQYLQFFLFPMRNAFFWKNLVQNVKIVSLKLNLLASLIRICRIQRRCSLFLFSIGNVFFGANVVQNFKIVGLKVNFSS